MGCWNGTCMISNLPITYQEKVKIFIIKQRSTGFISSSCYANEIFEPFGFPLEGEYNDYGGVQNIIEDLNYKIYDDYFNKRYPQIKVNNSISDFNFTDFLKDINREDIEFFSEGDVKLKELAQNIINESKGTDQEEHITKLYEGWANMDVSGKWRESHLKMVMVRKDVYDHIIKNLVTRFWREEPRQEGESYYQTANEWVDKKFKRFEQQSLHFDFIENPMSSVGHGLSNMTLEKPYYTELKKCPKSGDETYEYFKNIYTEYVILESFMSSTRRQWMVTTGDGSQSEEWNSYLVLNEIISSICQEKVEEQSE